MVNLEGTVKEPHSVAQVATKQLMFKTKGNFTILRGARFSCGSNYKAYNALDVDTGELYIIKEVLITNRAKENGEDYLLKLVNLRHDNIFELKSYEYEYVDENNWILYILQKFDFGFLSMSLFAEKNISITNDMLNNIARSILSVIYYMTTEKIHDISIVASSIFIDHNGNMKLYDFGLNNIDSYSNAGPSNQENPSVLCRFADMLAALYTGDIISTFSESFEEFLNKCRTTRCIDTSIIEELLNHLFIHEICSTIGCIPLQDKSFDDDNSRVSIERKFSRIENDFDIIEVLGKGNFGKVYKVRDRLDEKFYALKKINLTTNNRENMKTIREAKFLAHLEHENIVRYYHSWTDDVYPSDDSDDDTDDYTKSDYEVQQCSLESTSARVTFYLSEDHNLNEQEESESTDGQMEIMETDYIDTIHLLRNTLYIKMEFCESNTLKSAIDNNLYQDINRIWRFFKEIVEGLCYIHDQGIVHRDLKPVNIFLDCNDRVKIGDFGFATTKLKYHLHKDTETDSSNSQGGSYTSVCGTTYYRAPELSSTHTICDQKLDMYSLGVIFFEMCYQPINSGHERDLILTNLRSTNIIFPNNFYRPELHEQSEIIRKLLNHNPEERPSCRELRDSNCIPSREEDLKNMQMIRTLVDNSQSRLNKYLFEYLFATRNNNRRKLSYVNIHQIEKITRILFDIFKQYGGKNLDMCTTSLQSTCTNGCGLCIKLIDAQGSLVVLPCSDRKIFRKFVVSVSSKTTWLRRYAMHKSAIDNSYTCVFDIVTPIDLHKDQNYLPEAEILLILNEIQNTFPNLTSNFTIHVSHSLILEAIFEECDVLDPHYVALISTFVPKGQHRKVMLQFYMQQDTCDKYLKLLESSCIFKNFISGLFLKNFTKPGSKEKVRRAIVELKNIHGIAEELGLTTTIIFDPGCLFSNYDLTSGMLVELNYQSSRQTEQLKVAIGGRYDNYLKNIGDGSGAKNERYGVGITVSLDKLGRILRMGKPITVEQVTVCYYSKSALTEAITLIKKLRCAKIPCSFVKMKTTKQRKEFCLKNNVMCCILLRNKQIKRNKFVIICQNSIEHFVDIDDVIPAVEIALYCKPDNIVINKSMHFELPIFFGTEPELTLHEKFKCKIQLLKKLKGRDKHETAIIFVVNTTTDFINNFMLFCQTGKVTCTSRSELLSGPFGEIFNNIRRTTHNWEQVIFCNISEIDAIYIKDVLPFNRSSVNYLFNSPSMVIADRSKAFFTY